MPTPGFRYDLKVIRREGGRDRIRYHPCTGVEVTEYEDATHIELLDTAPAKGKPNKVIRLPQDGHRAHLLGENGHNVDSYRWPRTPPGKKEA